MCPGQISSQTLMQLQVVLLASVTVSGQESLLPCPAVAMLSETVLGGELAPWLRNQSSCTEGTVKRVDSMSCCG